MAYPSRGASILPSENTRPLEDSQSSESSRHRTQGGQRPARRVPAHAALADIRFPNSLVEAPSRPDGYTPIANMQTTPELFLELATGRRMLRTSITNNCWQSEQMQTIHQLMTFIRRQMSAAKLLPGAKSSLAWFGVRADTKYFVDVTGCSVLEKIIGGSAIRLASRNLISIKNNCHMLLIPKEEGRSLLFCVALVISWLYSRPAIPIISPGWSTLFSVMIFRRELWSTAKNVAVRVPWLTNIVLVAMLCSGLVSRGKPGRKGHARVNVDVIFDKSGQVSYGNVMKPLFFPSRTSHTRLFPKKHSFTYSYLLVGIPVGWRGAVGSSLSADLPVEELSQQSVFKRSWFSVGAGDYLERGDENLGLRGKLQAYLRSQGEDIQDYPYAYLVTAPRFLGYSFNPVSFWYLYNDRKDLQAIILEVNNTFDERRMYFLKASSGSTDSDDSWTVVENPCNRFRQTWPKDFHVSPFNSRKGSYALSAQDPFPSLLNGAGKIDNTITLNSSKAHVKLIARVFSTEPGIDPKTLSFWRKIRFIASWWWVGFVTFPRIVREAGKLFFHRKLHVWFRPEVLEDSIGRRATSDELIIERTFRSYLRFLVESSNLERPVKYVSPIPSPTEELFSPKSTSPTKPSQAKVIELKVTTPLFYARLARYSHISEYLSSEILNDDEKDRTFHVSDPKSLLHLFKESRPIGQDISTSSLINKFSIHNRLFWRFQQWLRNHVRQSERQPHQRNQVDIRRFGFSRLDQYAMRCDSLDQATRYRQAVTKLLLSDVIAFGHPGVLDGVSYVTRVVLSYMFVGASRVVWEYILASAGMKG